MDICPEKWNSVINSSKVYRNIFEAIQKMDVSVVIITQKETRITNINTFPTDKDHNIVFPNQ